MVGVTCSCGTRLPVVARNRAGRCPACGALLPAPASADPGAKSAGTTQGHRVGRTGGEPRRSARKAWKVRPAGWKGNDWASRSAAEAVSAGSEPSRDSASAAEGMATGATATRADGLIDCLLYPIAQRNGLLLLAVVPVGVSVAASQIDTRQNQSLVQAAFCLLLLVYLLYGLLFLGRVLVASALGQARHPRLWGWSLAVLLEGVGRWVWGCSAGLAIGGIPAVAYWVTCGDLDVVDRFLLFELASLGALYAQLALAAALLHDDVWAANPLRITRALCRLGKSYVPCCVVTTLALLLCALAYSILFEGPRAAGFFEQPGALWAFTAFVFYEAMVVFRVLGLFCHRQAAVLGWSRERPSWGA